MIDLAYQPKQISLRDLAYAEGPNVATKLGFGGARGGAKSGGARRLMIDRRLSLPGTTGFIIRRNFPDLYENYVVRFSEEFPEIGATYISSRKEYPLPNGSRIALRFADTYKEVEQISRGPEATDIMIDQAEQFRELELQMLATPNRRPGAPDGQCKTYYFFNPGGAGTEYLRRVFWTRDYRDQERPGDFAFIQACGWDNYEWFRGQVPIMPREFYSMEAKCDVEPRDPDNCTCCRFHVFVHRTSYGRKLYELPKDLRDGELLGSFDSFSGQYFAGVWDQRVCVLSEEECDEIIQPWWVRWMAQDWGFGDHTSHGWYASGKLSPEQWRRYFGGEPGWPMDVIVKYREYMVKNRAEGDLAMDIVDQTPDAEREHIRRFFLSQDAFGQKARQSGANTVGERFSDTMRRYGLPIPEPADQDRKNGWRFMHGCLRQAHLRGATFDKERALQGPAFFVGANCTQTQSCIPLATRDKDDPDDVIRVAGALWEDVTDETRYALKSMQDPMARAPVDVRAKELYASIQGTDAETMTRRANAMRQFWGKEGAVGRVGRSPRWRQ